MKLRIRRAVTKPTMEYPRNPQDPADSQCARPLRKRCQEMQWDVDSNSGVRDVRYLVDDWGDLR